MTGNTMRFGVRDSVTDMSAFAPRFDALATLLKIGKNGHSKVEVGT